ncbi:MAG: hypothetical protein U9R08_03530 [Nanoarchaeota archaeon]|nr:hypothetical protein [Nanoarchaeota archaeon]
MDDYEKQAEQFLADTQTTFTTEFVKHGKHFVDDEEERDIYKVTFTRGERSFFVMFGRSIDGSGYKVKTSSNNRLHGGNYYATLPMTLKDVKKKVKAQFETLSGIKIEEPKEPTAYDVLTCLQKYDPETFKDFCDNFGYDRDSIKANKIYKAVCEEYKNVLTIWSDKEIEKLQEMEQWAKTMMLSQQMK